MKITWGDISTHISYSKLIGETKDDQYIKYYIFSFLIII